MMLKHKKAASCTGIASLKLYRPTATYNRCYSSEDTLQDLLTDNKAIQQRRSPNKSQSFYTDNRSLPLPLVCFYSKEALINEYATPLDVLQYVSPLVQQSKHNDKLHLFIGVLHSLFTVINDLDFVDDEQDTDDDDSQVDECTVYEEWVETPSFSIVGLFAMKTIILDKPIKNLSLAIIVSSQFSDAVIEHYMQLLNTAVLDKQKKTSTVKEMGDQITTLIQHWFNPFH